MDHYEMKQAYLRALELQILEDDIDEEYEDLFKTENSIYS